MVIENNFINTQKSTEKISRLWLANEIMIKAAVGNIEISGKENLAKIPEGEGVVVMPTHMTDLDVPITIHSVGKNLDLMATNMSVHHKFFGKDGEAVTNFGMHVSGEKNFIPIDFKKDKSGPGGKSAEVFNPKNFDPAIKAIKNGKSVLIAAHKPLPEPAKNLDNVKGGFGGIYSALLADAYILPVTVVLDKNAGMYGNAIKTVLKRPNASVVIGEPFKLEKVEGLENFSILTNRIENGERLSIEELKEFKRLAHVLDEKSQEVIKRMSEQLSK